VAAMVATQKTARPAAAHTDFLIIRSSLLLG